MDVKNGMELLAKPIGVGVVPFDRGGAGHGGRAGRQRCRAAQQSTDIDAGANQRGAARPEKDGPRHLRASDPPAIDFIRLEWLQQREATVSPANRLELFKRRLDELAGGADRRPVRDRRRRRRE